MKDLFACENPICVSPTLAGMLGLETAIFLEKFHGWLQENPVVADGKPWIEGNLDAWGNKLVMERDEIAANARLVRQTLCDTSELEQEKADLGQELAVLVEMTQNCIAENARIAQDQGEYQKRYNGLVERYEAARTRFDEVTEAIAERSAKGERLAGVIRTLEAQREPVAEFDERLWGAMVDYATVGVDKRLTVVFRDGTGI